MAYFFKAISVNCDVRSNKYNQIDVNCWKIEGICLLVITLCRVSVHNYTYLGPRWSLTCTKCHSGETYRCVCYGKTLFDVSSHTQTRMCITFQYHYCKPLPFSIMHWQNLLFSPLLEKSCYLTFIHQSGKKCKKKTCYKRWMKHSPFSHPFTQPHALETDCRVLNEHWNACKKWCGDNKNSIILLFSLGKTMFSLL